MRHVHNQTLLCWLIWVLKFQSQRRGLAFDFDFEVEIEVLHDGVVAGNPVVKLQYEFISACHKAIELCLHEREFLIRLLQDLVGIGGFRWTLGCHRSNLVHVVYLP